MHQKSHQIETHLVYEQNTLLNDDTVLQKIWFVEILLLESDFELNFMYNVYFVIDVNFHLFL